MDQDRRELEGMKFGLAAMSWAGWGSPVGVGILLAASGFFLVCLHWANILH
jgi:hypothetical protein